MRKYVDTHCHLDKLYKLLKKPFGSAMEEWGEGLDGCVSVPLLSLGESALNVTHPKIKFAVGVHPLRARELTARMEARLCRFARMPQVCAIGEIGLDRYKGASEILFQKGAFIRQVQIAVSFNLPICIHTRQADDETYEILKRYVPPHHKFHVHCFSDSLEFCEKVLSNWTNAFFGVTGKILYPNAEHVKEICRLVPMERILAETDAPYLKPPQWKEQYSSPGLIPLIISEIAKTKRVDEDAAFLQLRENAKYVYGV